MVFFQACELFGYLNKYYSDLRETMDESEIHIDISSYGISLFDEKFGDEHDEELQYCTKSNAKKFMESLRGTGPNTRIIIGMPPLRYGPLRKAKFGMNEPEFRRRAAEIRHIGYEYGVECYPTSESHMKMYRINEMYILGGINFGNSYWTDSAVVLENEEDKETAQFIFDCTYLKAARISPIAC